MLFKGAISRSFSIISKSYKHFWKPEITLLLYLNFKYVSFAINNQDGNGLQTVEQFGPAFAS